MVLHEALLNGMSTSLSRNHQHPSPLRPDGGSSPGKRFPHGYLSPNLSSHNLYKNPRPNVLHASGGGRGNLHHNSSKNLTQSGLHSPPSFDEAIRGQFGRFANPLFNVDQGVLVEKLSWEESRSTMLGMESKLHCQNIVQDKAVKVILEDGSLIDIKGKVVDLKNVLTIMTSNVGSSTLQKGGHTIRFLHALAGLALHVELYKP
ncbi:hypothetical protein L7F22_049565 [Adiantum nelumboides]|nr:hypothetical protein [Adiantum nelumboides]